MANGSVWYQITHPPEEPTFTSSGESAGGRRAIGSGWGETEWQKNAIMGTWTGDPKPWMGTDYYQNRPRYLVGDQVAILHMEGLDVAGLQDVLHGAGYLKGSWSSGDPNDPKTRDAMNKLLGDANEQGLAWLDMLGYGMDTSSGSGGGRGGGGGGGGAALPTAEELGLIFDKVTQETLGRYLDPAEKDAMVGQWMSNPTINPGDFAEIQTGRGSAEFGTEYTAEQFGRLGQDVMDMFSQSKPAGQLSGRGY